MGTLLKDLRHSVRMLLRNPGFSAVALITLALGIGANTAIFSVVNAILLRPLAYGEPERLVTITHSYKKLNNFFPISGPSYVDYRDQNTVFDDIAVSMNWNVNLTGRGEPERISGRLVSASFFPVLGVAPEIGRAFVPEEDQPGRNKVVVLSHGLWERLLGNDPGALNQTLSLNDENYQIVGVMPASFKHRQDEIWAPIALGPQQLAPERRGNENLGAIARLKAGTSLQQAREEMNVISSRVMEQYPDAYPRDGSWGIALKPISEEVLGNIGEILWVLLGAVMLVLLIACANIANLLLARAMIRHKEITIRAALGASRSRLIRQLLTESLLLSLMGGLAGLVLSVWGVRLLIAMNQTNIPRAQEVDVDSRVLLFTLAVSVATGILFGLIPALKISKANINEGLKEGGRGTITGFRLRSFRSFLVVAEVAIALILTISSSLVIKSFLRLQDVDLGFNTQGILTMQVALPNTRYRQPGQIQAFYQQALDSIKALPGVQSVGAITNLPLSNTLLAGNFDIEGKPLPPGQTPPHSDRRGISSDYLETMKIHLQKGRYFTEKDNAQSAPVAIIDETLANQYWPGEDPIGRHLTFEGGKTNPIWREIVGVVGRVKYKGAEGDIKGQLYYPYQQNSLPSMFLAIQASNDPAGLIPSAREAIRAVDKDLPIFRVKTMEQLVDDSLAQRRFSMSLLMIFAVLALCLAAVGHYGVVSYSVTQRSHEIGIRMAMGAQPRDIFKLVVGQGLSLTAIGIIIGVAFALGFTRVVSSLLFAVSTTDPGIYTAMSVLLIAVGGLACFIPARRAMRVDPIVALRYE